MNEKDKNQTGAGISAALAPLRFREKKIKCFGSAESGPFAELENGDRVYGFIAAAPDLLAAAYQAATTLEAAVASDPQNFAAQNSAKKLRAAIAKSGKEAA